MTFGEARRRYGVLGVFYIALETISIDYFPPEGSHLLLSYRLTLLLSPATGAIDVEAFHHDLALFG